MDKDKREGLDALVLKVRTAQKAFTEASKPLRALLKPFDDAIEQLEDEIFSALSEAGVEIIGQCEGCERAIFAGDRAHHTDDGCWLCEEDSPTWDDIKEQWDSGRGEHDEMDRSDFMEAYAAHIAAGGKPTDIVSRVV